MGIAPPPDYSVTQERAWTSPIWYTPSDAARQNVQDSPPVDQITAQRAVALTGDELAALIVEKSPWLQNTVTGETYQLVYSAAGPTNTPLVPRDPDYVTSQFAANQGQVQIHYVARGSLQPSVTGDLASASELGTTESPTSSTTASW